MNDAPQETFIPVQSSVLQIVAHGVSGILELTFRSGAVYRYSEVPSEIVHALLAAESKGAFFNRHIRDHFPYQHVA